MLRHSSWHALLVVLCCYCAFIRCCLPTEFTCESGQCVDGSRFCDGTTDCADGTDEHHGCTNCNRTYYGLSGVKYPLRLNEAVRHTGSVCSLSFIASGGVYGDLVEITFLSFHIGVFQLESTMCYQGYMEIEDSKIYTTKKRSVRYLRRSRKKGSTSRKDSGSTRMNKLSPNGAFCGKMIGEAATFYSSGDKVNLNIFTLYQVSDNTAAPRLYLTYRFLHRGAEPFATRPNETLDADLNKTCEFTYTDCYTQTCKIRSPNYPGFYLRNLTCLYRIKQLYTLPEQIAQVEVYQDNEFKINVLSGLTNNDRYKPGVLTSDCAGDLIRVYDGQTRLAPLLAEFCGSGPLPPVRSSGPDLLVELRSVAYQPLSSSKFELKVRIHFVSESSFRITSNQCAMTVDASRTRSGVLNVPNHSISANTTCSFRMSGKRPSERIWLYFMVYNVPDLHPWSDLEHCDVARLSIIYPKLKFRHRHHQHHSYSLYQNLDASALLNGSKTLVGTFCEKTSPRQCGHAFDFTDYIPSRPCSVVTESYLSTGPELLLEFDFMRTMAVHGTTPNFVARYELVDFDQPVGAGNCIVKVRSSSGSTGWLENPRNLFLYGRGGKTALDCLYELRGEENERVRVVVQKVKFPSSEGCETTHRKSTMKYKCALTNSDVKYAIINVTELWNKLELPVGCLCDGHSEHWKEEDQIVFESVSNEMDLRYLVRNMGPRDDFRTFHFEVKYEFLHTTVCDADDYVITGIEGRVTLDIQSKSLCRWLLVSLPSRSLYVTVKGRKMDTSCQNKYIFYGLHDEDVYAAYCASEEEEYDSLFAGFLSGHQANTQQLKSDTGITVLEIVAGHPGHFNVHWIEVTRRSREDVDGPLIHDCELECPELEACISSDLACDGISHCPRTAEDESPERCSQSQLPTVIFCIVTAIIMCIVIFLLVIVVRHRLHRRRKTPVPTHHMTLTSVRKNSAIMTTRIG